MRTLKDVMKICLCLLIGLMATVSAQETPQPSQEGPLSVNYFGELGWIVKYGLGDSRELSRHGYATQLLFEQYIALNLDAGVQVDWPVSGVLYVSAQLDNRKSDNLQSFKLGYTASSLDAAFEDFSMQAGSSDFVATDRLLKGLRFSWDISNTMKLSGKFARVEGVAQSRTFRGNTSQEVAEFTLNDPDQPWREATYQRNLKGLEYFQVRSYVPGFTTVSLRFELTPQLRTLLTNYGLEYLIETIKDDPEPELATELYDVIVEKGSNFLILKRQSLELLREQIHTYIEDYNDEHDLFDENAKEYPLAEGTDYEQGFLKNLSKLVRIATPDEAFSLDGAARGRFFYLGRESVKEETLKIEIKRQGTYVQLPDPDLPRFQFMLFPEQGVVALDFPEEFFTDPQSAVRITFDYAVSGGLYVLGLAVLQNSERVSIKREGDQDWKLLKRDQDYQMDYETGALLLLPPYDVLGEKDELKIEYELMRGGLGGFAEHQRVFTGLSYQWAPWPFLRVSLDALRAFDTPPSAEDRDRLRTMPNTHSVLGLAAQLSLGDLKAELKAGYTENIFPTVPLTGTGNRYHTNERRSQRNRINVIAELSFEGRRATLFGHQNGLLVYDGTRWQDFTTAHGLSGRGVRGIAIQRNTMLLATDSGLSLVQLEPGRPILESLAKPINWKRFYSLDGLPHNETNDVLVDRSGTVWIGTKGGVARVPLAQITEKSAWKVFKRSSTPALKNELINKLASDGTRLYLGTDAGLVLYEEQAGQFTEIAPLQGKAIYDLVVAGTTVYAATDEGVYELSEGQGLGWRVAGIKVLSVAVQGTELWYGTEIGLFRLGSDFPVIQEYSVTAIEKNARDSELWVGPWATATFELPLWEIDSWGGVKTRSQAETRLNGRDEFRFADISPNQNTDHGWLAQFSAQYKWGSLEIKALLEGITPEFLAIGGESRQDAQRLTLSAAWPILSNLSLSADHVMGFSGGWRTFVMTDTLRTSWQPWEGGPQFSGAFALELTDRDTRDRSAGFDTTKIALNLKGDHKMSVVGLLPLGQELTVGATYDGVATLARLGRLFLDSTWELSVRLAMTPSLKLRGSLMLGNRFTLGAQLPSDSDLRYTLGGDWQYDLGFGQLTTSYTQTNRVRAGRGSSDENASLTLRFSDFTLADITLSPTVTLSGRRTATVGSTPPSGTLTLTAEGRLSGQWQALSGSLSTRQTLSSDVRSARDSLKQEFNSSVAWALSPQFQPRLELGLTLDTLRHPTLGSKQTVRPRARLSVDWNPDGTWKTGADLFWQMTLSERERNTTYELGGRVSWDPLTELSLSLDAHASLDVGVRDTKPVNAATWELTVHSEYELGTFCAPTLDGSDCTVSASLGYSGRLDQQVAVPFGQGIFLQAQVGLNF